MKTFDIGIVGSGVIGLSIAYQVLQDAAQAGVGAPSIVVIDRPQSGQASWAGSGILPPPPRQPSADPIEQLQRLSLSQMQRWSDQLREMTGIDNQYHQCGGYYLALSPGEQAALIGLKSFWDEMGTQFQILPYETFCRDEPWLSNQLPESRCQLIARIPEETQLRNPRHLKALRAACEMQGVTFVNEYVGVPDSVQPFQLTLQGERLEMKQVVVATGSWSSVWLDQLLPDRHGVSVFPVKGQILMYRAPSQVFQSIVNFGTRYFVPRRDGHILVGSTEEEVGFDARPTAEVKAELEQFIFRTLPEVASFPQVDHWAGFRPASFDQTPILGRLPGAPHILMATGHFRSGIQWSIGTAICVAAMLADREPPIDVRVFAPGR